MGPRSILVGIVSVALAAFTVGCGSNDSSLLPMDGPRAGGAADSGGGVPGQPALLPDGAANPQYCTAGLTECSSACVDLTTDKNNCGACGTACGGTCTASRCIVTLATGGTGGAIALDSTSVYFSGAGGLMKVAIGGGTVATLAPTATGPVTVDSKNVYYTTPYGVMTVPVAGGTPTKLGNLSALALTNNAAGVCWAAGNGDILSVPVPGYDAMDGGADDGGGPDASDASTPFPTGITLAYSENDPAGLFASPTALYWTTSGTLSGSGGFTPLSGTVMRLEFAALDDGGAPSDGGGTAAVATGQNYPLAIVADTANVYWTASGTNANGYSDGTVMKAPVGGGAPVSLASAQAFPYGIASDGANVYWANNDNAGTAGAIMSVPIAGGTATTLAAGLTAPTYVAVDATSLYWTTHAGAVMKVTPK
jgi:hypothetical protein